MPSRKAWSDRSERTILRNAVNSTTGVITIISFWISSQKACQVLANLVQPLVCTVLYNLLPWQRVKNSSFTTPGLFSELEQWPVCCVSWASSSCSSVLNVQDIYIYIYIVSWFKPQTATFVPDWLRELKWYAESWLLVSSCFCLCSRLIRIVPFLPSCCILFDCFPHARCKS